MHQIFVYASDREIDEDWKDDLCSTDSVNRLRGSLQRDIELKDVCATARERYPVSLANSSAEIDSHIRRSHGKSFDYETRQAQSSVGTDDQSDGIVRQNGRRAHETFNAF